MLSNIEANSCNHCFSGKQISITFYEYVFVALGIQHAMRTRPIILSSVIFRYVTPVVFSNAIRRGFLMSLNTTKFARCYYFKLTTCFVPCSGPSSGHKCIYSRKLYSISHKIYQSKLQRDLVFVQYSAVVRD